MQKQEIPRPSSGSRRVTSGCHAGRGADLSAETNAPCLGGARVRGGCVPAAIKRIAVAHFPGLFYRGAGLTRFKIVSEYLIIVALVASLVSLDVASCGSSSSRVSLHRDLDSVHRGIGDRLHRVRECLRPLECARPFPQDLRVLLFVQGDYQDGLEGAVQSAFP